MIIEIPEKVGKIINTLENNGFEAYAVGGCVRDAILGRKPSDWDITTSALPQEVEDLFDKTFETGIKHGTITVVVEKENFEVTTFRTEEGYSDYRRPDKVNFVRNLEEDLKRRDFTINAMAYNPSRGLIDLFMGVEDLKNGVIRAVGDPYDRFNEDALRMLRAVRFAARFGFEIEESTEEGIHKCSALIDKISKERIREEISGILMSEHPEYISKLNDLGILEHILPELAKCFKTPQNNPYHSFNVGMHIMEALKNSAADLLVRWAVMLHDVGKAYTRTTDKKGVDHFRGHDRVSEEIALRVLSEYKLDNNSKNTILLLIRHHDRQILPEEKAARRALNKLGEDLLRLLILVKRADNAGKNPEKFHKGNAALDLLEKVLNDVIIKNQCTSLKDLNIKGEELIKIGIPPGPVIGEVLSNLLDKVIDNPKLNNKEILLNEAKKLVSVYKR